MSTEIEKILDHYSEWGSPRWSSIIPGRPAELVAPPDDLPPALLGALAAMGRTSLYTHQRETIELVRRGEDVLLVTSTASGKTLAFNAAILDRLLRQTTGRALYIFPLNALANDQHAGLQHLVSLLPAADRPTVAVLTGQTSSVDRLSAPAARLLLTNPESVHFNILQRPDRWRGLLSELAFVVLDEAHMYRGAFGAHVAHVIRRLLRLAAAAGSRPLLIAASATIGNPDQLGKMLTNRAFTRISEDGSARPARELVVWEPQRFSSGARSGVEHEAAALLIASLRAGRSVILFARSRRSVESLTDRIRRDLGDPQLAAKIEPYRGGYTPAERKRIEEGLRSGQIRAVITTNALEAGIDIGSLDVAIIAGYPGSMMGFWQQAGRVGRRDSASVIIYVPSANPLDEYFAEQPQRLLDTPHEIATFDPWNARIAVDHILWRAQEAPISIEGPWETPQAKRITERLVEEGLLRRSAAGYVATEPLPYEVSIRSTGRPFAVVDERGARVGEVDEKVVYRECHPGAIYVHQGRAYRVSELDVGQRTVLAGLVGAWNIETKASMLAEIEVIEVLADETFGQEGLWRLRLAQLAAHESYRSYEEGPRSAGVASTEFAEERTQHPIDPPLDRTLRTVGMVIDVPSSVSPNAAHAIEHALLGLIPTQVMCDRSDFTGLTDVDTNQVYLYDRSPEGLGFAESAFERFGELAAAAADRLGTCGCADGCPQCVQSAACERRNEGLAKLEASVALDHALGVERVRAPQQASAPPTTRLGGIVERSRGVADSFMREDWTRRKSRRDAAAAEEAEWNRAAEEVRVAAQLRDEARAIELKAAEEERRAHAAEEARHAARLLDKNRAIELKAAEEERRLRAADEARRAARLRDEERAVERARAAIARQQERRPVEDRGARLSPPHRRTASEEWQRDGGWAAEDFRVNDWARHSTFGDGRVQAVSAGERGLLVVVEYRDGSVRELIGGVGDLQVRTPLRPTTTGPEKSDPR